MILDLGLLVAGFIVLFWGANGLVRGSGSVALRMRVSPLVVGLTIVAFGTSMPELVVSVKAGWSGQGAIAVGNVVGSNIFNVALILGIAALLSPMRIHAKILRLDVPLMIGSSLLFVFFYRDHRIVLGEGLFFVLLFAAYTGFNIWMARRDPCRGEMVLDDGALPEMMSHWGWEVLSILGGLGLLVLGADWLVRSAVSLAQAMGVSEAVIGLTIVALGTSLPELATSIVAAWHRQSEIAVGNVIGSNIFNLLCILGVAALISPVEGHGIGRLDLWAMVISAGLVLPFFWTRFELNRREGAILVTVYVVYLLLLLRQEVWLAPVVGG